jgi:hypothetical protein
MQISASHREAEARFLRLVADAGLQPPNAFEYAAQSVTFYWYESMVAVIVDLDDAEAPMVI